MSIERFIARRYLLGKKRFSFINIISLLATLGIAFGVASLIVVMAVFNGFNSLVLSILQDVDPHIKLERIPGAEGRSLADVQRLLEARNPAVTWAPYIERKAIAVAGGYNNFAWVKGYDPERVDRVSGIRRKVLLGRADADEEFGVLVGLTLADRLRVLVGDTLTLVSPAGMEAMLTQVVTPTVFRCPVVGLFDSKNKAYDGSYVFMRLPTAMEFFRNKETGSGFELRFEDIDRSNTERDRLAAEIGPGWNVLTWYDLHKDLYSVMKIERWSAFVLLGVIIAVAVFNILASLTMLVLEKKRDIGILRAMGLPAVRVQRIFLLQGLWIGFVGVTAGLAIGLLLTWLQQNYGLVRLDAAFIIPALPMEIRASDIAIIIVSTFLLCLAAAWIPARRSRNVNVIDAIRWE